MENLKPFIEQKVEKISRAYMIGTKEKPDFLHTIHTQYSERMYWETDWKITGGDCDVYVASEREKQKTEKKNIKRKKL